MLRQPLNLTVAHRMLIFPGSARPARTGLLDACAKRRDICWDAVRNRLRTCIQDHLSTRARAPHAGGRASTERAFLIIPDPFFFKPKGFIMDMQLKDKVAVITGGSVGIGLAVAEALAFVDCR